MTPVEFKDARISLGLSQSKMAEALGLKTSRAIRQYEAGDRAVSGPITMLVGILMERSK